MQLNTQNPYRYLFPVGAVNSFLGAALWIAFRAGWIDFYPAGRHANFMIGGFLLVYALGFLWTAIPRFLQAPSAGKWELAALITLLALTPPFGLLQNPVHFYSAALAALLLTLRFGRNRFRLRRNDPPPSFVFVAVGLLLAAASILVLIIHELHPLPPLLAAAARNFFLKGYTLCLVLGVGMKLLPALLGRGPLPSSSGGRFRLDRLSLFALGLLLAGVILESAGEVRLAGSALGLALFGSATLRLHLFSLPRARSGLGYSVWASVWIFALAPFTLIFFPEYTVHFWHLIFICGFGLLTLAVSLRVVLAHSGHEFLRWEARAPLYVIASLVLLAMLTRVSAPFLGGESILGHYAYAAGAWIGAVVAWMYCYLRLTFAPRPESAAGESC